MTFDQWTQLMSKEIFVPIEEDPKVENKVFEMVYEDLEEEDS